MSLCTTSTSSAAAPSGRTRRRGERSPLHAESFGAASLLPKEQKDQPFGAAVPPAPDHANDVGASSSSSSAIRDAKYLCTIAAELNDVGSELHNSLALFKDGGSDEPKGLEAMAMDLYKEAASTMLETVEMTSVSVRRSEMRRAKRRMEMIVQAKEKLLDARWNAGEPTADVEDSPADMLRDVMFSDHGSACDAGPRVFDQAIKVGEATLASFDRSGAIDNDSVGSVTLCNIGLIQLRRSRRSSKSGDHKDGAAILDSAMRFFRMSLTASSEQSARCGVDVITARNNLGHGLYSIGAPVEAAESFLAAAREIGGSAAAACLDAEELLELVPSQSFSTDGAAGKRTSGSFSSAAWKSKAEIVLLCNAARALYAAGDVDESFRCCIEALELCICHSVVSSSEEGEEADPQVSAIAIALLFNLGVLFEQRDLHDRALRCYRLFIDKAPTDSTSEIVVALTRILLLECESAVSGDSGLLDDAVEVVRTLRHLEAVRSKVGRDHPSLAAVLRCVGSSLSEREEHKYALPFLLEGLRIESSAFQSRIASASEGENLPSLGADIVVALNALGECYHGLGHSEEAVACYDEVQTLKAKHMSDMLLTAASSATLSPSSVRFIFAVTLYNGGRVQFERGQREESGRFFDEALSLVSSITRSASSTSSSSLFDRDGALRHMRECASLRHNIGQYHVELGRTADALECFCSALEVRRDAADVDPSELSETLRQLGGLLHKTGDHGRALAILGEALEVERTLNDGEESPSAVAVLYDLAHVRYERCELENALELFHCVLDIVSCPDYQAQKGVVGVGADEDTISAGRVLGWIGTVQGEMGLIEEARTSFEESARMDDTERRDESNPAPDGNHIALSTAAFVELLDSRPAAAA